MDRYAQAGDPRRFTFPSSEVGGLNFSFSGIKTAFLYFLREEKKKDERFIEKNLHDICASLQYSLIQMLLKKLGKASEQYGIKELALAGGVSANSGLRKVMDETAVKKGWNVYIPDFQYCTDNAAMIAITAHFKFLKKEFVSLRVSPEARMKF